MEFFRIDLPALSAESIVYKIEVTIQYPHCCCNQLFLKSIFQKVDSAERADKSIPKNRIVKPKIKCLYEKQGSQKGNKQ